MPHLGYKPEEEAGISEFGHSLKTPLVRTNANADEEEKAMEARV
jgi:hypothetical protein